MARSTQVVSDCADPDRLATFRATALGYRKQGVPGEPWNSASAVVDPDGAGPRTCFHRVPEPEVVKNRVHLDLNAGGPPGTPPQERRRRADAEVERLVRAGATRLRAVEQHGEYWVVLQEPEGNEFCLQ